LLRIWDATRNGFSREIGELVEQFGVSQRTIFRDLEFLKSLGVQPILRPTDSPHPSHSNSVLEPDEILALILAARSSWVSASPRLGDASRSAIAKLLRQAPETLQKELTSFARSTHFDNPASQIPSSVEKRVLHVLRAICENHPIEISVEGPSKETVQHLRIWPQRLLAGQSPLALKGRCKAPPFERVFEIEQVRILSKPKPRSRRKKTALVQN
jgi:predicted DNA-binding transcriptional regulator YafY